MIRKLLVVAFLTGPLTAACQTRVGTSPAVAIAQDSITMRATILRTIMVARYNAGGGDIRLDACATSKVLGVRLDSLPMILPESNKEFPLMGTSGACPDSSLSRNNPRLVPMLIRIAGKDATVELTFVNNGSAHSERYSLRSYVAGGRVIWGVSEIRFYRFAIAD
jgi:hypothetical protein